MLEFVYVRFGTYIRQNFGQMTLLQSVSRMAKPAAAQFTGRIYVRLVRYNRHDFVLKRCWKQIVNCVHRYVCFQSHCFHSLL